ncbi:MAG: hypothetical protein HY922_05975 [Elusimicrobia bacterium]|nr:hypothetical protein [Elusimicrobiota bacterium]
MTVGLTLLLAACAGLSRAASAGSFSASSVEESSPRVEYIEDKAAELKDAVANPTSDAQQLHALAQRLFERIPEKTSSDIPAVSLRGWEKPERRSEGNVDGLMQKMREGLEIHEVPAPAQTQMIDAYLYGDAMRRDRLMRYDEDDKLTPAQIGAYEYTEDSAVAILYNKAMRIIQRFLGDEFAASTAVHESAHTRDHYQGKLNPIEVKKGEKLAFETEYWWLKIVDPSGEKLCWARATLGKFGAGRLKAPDYVGDYLEHLASIRDYGDKGDLASLVDKLGYQDRKVNPFH